MTAGEAPKSRTPEVVAEDDGAGVLVVVAVGSSGCPEAPAGVLEHRIDPDRKLPRLRKNLTFLLPDGWTGDVVDLSASGMRIQSLVLLPPMTELEGKLVLPDGRAIPVKADVVWSNPPDHRNFVPAETGLELIDVSSEYLAALADLFAE
ncbi:MAG: PilZ domain-containing protein [Myxococcaceae bacterium]